MAKFEFLRVNLTRPETPPLLASMQAGRTPESREAFLKRAFGETRDFFYHRRACRLIPIDDAPDGYLAGYFARKGTIATADEHLNPVEWPAWEKAVFVLDLAATEQVVAMQYHPKVGHPKLIVERLLEAAKGTQHLLDYDIHVEYVVNKRDYWAAAKEYEGRIEKIAFTFLPPNAFKSKDKVVSLLQQLTPETGADKAKLIYESEGGHLNPSADLLAASAEVAMEGAGELAITADGRQVFTSSSGRLTKSIDNDAIPTPENANRLAALIKRLFRKKDND